MPKSQFPYTQTIARSIRTASLSGVSALTLAMAASVSAPATAQEVIDDQVNSGSVTVPGTEASPWELDYSLHIGDFGTGTLTIENGGRVEMTGPFGTTLGTQETGNGTVAISGTDGAGNASTLLSTTGFTIGNDGQGTLLIEGGGVAQSTNTGTSVRIGWGEDSTGTATVTGTDGNRNASSWLNVGSFYVGGEGAGTLRILDGGLVTSGSGWIYGWEGGENTAIVSGVNADGTASTWNAEGGPMVVGDEGRGVLLIEDGGIVRNFGGIIGRSSGTASEATVTGAGSQWINGAGLTVGEYGEGLLTVTDGGVVSASGVYAGGGDDGDGGTIIVSGNGSTLTSGGLFHVGDRTTGVMLVTDGGVVSAGEYIRIGSATETTGEVVVSGSGSSMTSDYRIHVGNGGQGTLTITDGAAAAGDEIVIGANPPGVGTTVISGSGSTLTADSLFRIGHYGLGTLTVTGGAVVSTLGEATYGDDGFIGQIEGSDGTLNIGAAAGDVAEQAGVFDLEVLIFGDGDGTVVFNHTDDDYVFGPGLESDGDGTHRIEHYAGHTTLTGDGSTFTGLTTLSGGTLIVGVDGAGSLGGDIDVQPSTLLGGSGAVGSPGSMVSIGSGATLAPGNSIGTLSVAGDVLLANGSIFEVEIAGGGTTPGIHNDLLAVGGTATLEGGTVEVVTLDPAASYQDWQVYTILTADAGVEGEFLEAVSESAFITTELTHNADNVVLGVGLVNAPEPEPEPEPEPGPEPEPEPTPGLFPTVAGTYNQTQAATGLDDLDQTSGSDALAVYNQILVLSAEEAREAFDMTSGEIHASGQHVINHAMGQFGRTLQQQGAAGIATQGENGPVSPPAYGASAGSTGVAATDDELLYSTSPAAAWLAPLGGRGTIPGDGNAARLDWWTAGLAGGYQAPFDLGTGNAFAGFGLGYIRSHGAVDERRSTHDADNFLIGAYGGWTDGPWALSGSLAYGASHIETERHIVFGGIDRTVEGDYWAHSVGLSTELAYGFDLGGGTTISPLFTLDAGWSGHNGFTETGADALSLTGAAESWMRLDTGIGLGISHVVLTETGRVTLEGRVVWEHAFADVIPSQSMSFAGSPTSFEVLGPDAGRDRLRLGAGLAWDVSDEITLRANYEGLFSGTQDNHVGSIGLNVRF